MGGGDFEVIVVVEGGVSFLFVPVQCSMHVIIHIPPQVESQLQSRLTMVEGERRRLAVQVESMERAQQEAREQQAVELEALT